MGSRPLPAVPSGRRPGALDTFHRAALTTPGDTPPLELRAVTAWLLGVTASQQTRTAYARDLGQFTGFIRNLDGATLTTATPDHVNAWWQSMTARGLALKTIGRKLAAASSFYAYSREPGRLLSHLPANPAQPTRARRTPKGAGRRTPALSAGQMRAVVAACDTPQALLLVLLLGSTGARITELLSANRGAWQEREDRQVLAVMGKGRKQREVALAPHVVSALDAAGVRHRPTTAPILIDRTGRRLAYGQATYLLEDIGRRAGLTRTLRPHQFRATYATRARLDHEADINDIAEQLGHATTEMTQVYIREARAGAIGADLNARIAAAMMGDQIASLS